MKGFSLIFNPKLFSFQLVFKYQIKCNLLVSSLKALCRGQMLFSRHSNERSQDFGLESNAYFT